ncbi:MAG: glycosyltransferase family 4 protein [Aggregatilineales bacterium]
MTRLLYLVNIPRFFVSHRLPLALAARDAGYEVHVAAAGGDARNIETIRAVGLPFHPLPLRQHGTDPTQELAAARAIYALYRRLQPDIVHQVTIKAVIYGGAAARLARVPAVVNAITGLGYVFTEQGAKVALLRAVSSVAYRLVLAHPNSLTIFQNPDDLELFVRSRLIPRERAVLVRGSGVDMREFQPQPEPDGPPVVLFVGRLLWLKGVGEFVEAARRLRAAGVRARFAIVGYSEAGNPVNVPAETLAAWEAEGVVELWGRRDDMPQVYAAAHVVCLPSSHREGIPRVLIEAGACGRAVVAADVSGSRDIVRDGENGLLVPPRNAEALAAALRRLIEDDDLRRRLGARGREIASAEYSFEGVAAATLAVYRQLLEQARP